MENACQEYEHMLHLLQIPIVGDVNAKTLISYCGSAEAVLKESKKNLLKIPQISDQTAKNIIDYIPDGTVEKELEFIEKFKIEVLTYTHIQYPKRLKQLIDSPLLLFKKGNMNLNHNRTLAIVGTRKNTQYGKEITQQIVHALKPFNLHIISGLAYGIDSIAHQAANEANIENAAVLAHGLHTIYPYKNAAIARQLIQQGGALLTEYWSQTAMHPSFFPARNRIVAGMADACLVVESEPSGGSLITAKIAHKYKRKLMAIPGRIGDKMSSGCNMLIKNGMADIIECASDIAHFMDWDLQQNQAHDIHLELFKELTPDEQAIVEILKNGKISYDQLLILSQVPMSRLTTSLLQLELNGIVHALPGKTFGLATKVYN